MFLTILTNHNLKINSYFLLVYDILKYQITYVGIHKVDILA